MENHQKKVTYKDSGVDIDSGNLLVDKIKPFAKSTMRPGADSIIGGFGGLFDFSAVQGQYKNPILVAATDGVGTKLKIAFATNKHHTIGIDLVAMCVNDIVVQGAEPLFFLDYFATSKLNVENATNVIAGIADGCKLARAALIGGETAEMPGMYQDNHYDLAGFSVGIVDQENILPSNDIKAGDVIIGIKSSGLHSNGFSLVNYLLQKHNIKYHDNSPFDNKNTIGDILLTPTKIYVKECLEAHKAKLIKAFCHITGGGLIENLPRILPNNLNANLNYDEFPEIFNWIQKLAAIDKNEMMRTFNCGIGMAVITNKENESDLLELLNKNNANTAFVIGNVTN